MPVLISPLTKDSIPALLAVIVAIGFITFLWLLAFHDIPQGTHDLMMTMTGVLGTAFGTIIGYHFGSSAGSAEKTRIMQTTGAIPNATPNGEQKP